MSNVVAGQRSRMHRRTALLNPNPELNVDSLARSRAQYSEHASLRTQCVLGCLSYPDESSAAKLSECYRIRLVLEYRYTAERYNDRKQFVLHFVPGREVFNIMFQVFI